MIGVYRLARTPLRMPAFRHLWIGLLLSYMGNQFTYIALLWFVLQLTGSGLALGLVLLCFSLPAVVTSALIGPLLDRFEPRLVMGLDNLVRAAVIGAMPVLYWLGALPIGVVYALALLAGITAPATNVGLGVLLPRLVPDQELEAANALMSLCLQISQLAGPSAAGLCVSLLGGPTVMLIDAASFLVMAAILWSLPDTSALPTPQADRAPGGLGFRALLGRANIRLLTAMSFIFFLAYYPTEPALPLYSRSTLHAGAGGYGLLLSAFGAGALIGVLATPWVGRLPRPGIALAVSAALWGLLLLPLTFLHALGPASFFFALAGISWGPYTATELTLLQRLAPAKQRGEILGAQASLVAATGPLGQLLGGALLIRFSAAQVIGLSAAACILAGVVGLLSPTLRAIPRMGGNARPDAVAD